MTPATLTLRPATAEDCRQLFAWRNHPDVYRHFLSAQPVEWKDHQAWFTEKLQDPQTRIFMAESDAQAAGMVRFDRKSGGVYISVTVEPCLFGRGLGSALIKEGTERFFAENGGTQTVLAEIKPANTASQKAFSRAGYRLIKETNDLLIYEFRRT